MSPAKPSLDLITTFIAEAVAFYLAVQVYYTSGLSAAFIVSIAASWLAYRISTPDGIWNALGMLVNPMQSMLLIGAAAIVYFGLQGYTTSQLLLTGIGFTLIGAAAGLVVEGYWNIA